MRRALQFACAMAVGGALSATGRGQFELQDSTTTADLRGIVSVGNGTAWASGTHGTVLRTEDSGFVWQGCAMPPGAEKLDFRGIQAFDDQTAIVMSSGKGDLSRVYKTTDGCLTWKLVFTNPDADGFFDAIRFRSNKASRRIAGQRRGVLVGDPVNGLFTIFMTANEGDTWTRWAGDSKDWSRKDATALQGEGMFAASNSSVVTRGLRGEISFVTGGTSGSRLISVEAHSPLDAKTMERFSATKLPLAIGASAGAFSISPRDPEKVVSDFMVVGGDYAKPEASASAIFLPSRERCCDVGVFSQRFTVSLTNPHGYRSSVAYDLPSKTWITVGPNGTDVSSDDGRNWKRLQPAKGDAADADRNWNALSLPFVVGPHGRIGRLRDGVLSSAAGK